MILNDKKKYNSLSSIGSFKKNFNFEIKKNTAGRKFAGRVPSSQFEYFLGLF